MLLDKSLFEKANLELGGTGLPRLSDLFKAESPLDTLFRPLPFLCISLPVAGLITALALCWRPLNVRLAIFLIC